jgi:hypothetical protein
MLYPKAGDITLRAKGISNDQLSLDLGKSANLRARVNGKGLIPTMEYVFVSEPAGAVTWDAKRFRATATSAGTATLTIRAQGKNGFTDGATRTITIIAGEGTASEPESPEP